MQIYEVPPWDLFIDLEFDTSTTQIWLKFLEILAILGDQFLH